MQDHIFFKVSTSNHDPHKGEIIEMAAIRTDGEGNTLASCTDRIKPKGEVDVDIAKINGYTARDWTDAVTFRVAIDSMRSSLLKGRSQKTIVVGFFAEYDRAFLLQACKNEDVDDPFDGRAWIDVAQLAWPLVYGEVIQARTMSEVARYYSVTRERPDVAPYEVEAIKSVYFKMMKRYAMAVSVETGARKLGSNLLSKIVGGM